MDMLLDCAYECHKNKMLAYWRRYKCTCIGNWFLNNKQMAKWSKCWKYLELSDQKYRNKISRPPAMPGLSLSWFGTSLLPPPSGGVFRNHSLTILSVSDTGLSSSANLYTGRSRLFRCLAALSACLSIFESFIYAKFNITMTMKCSTCIEIP